MQSLVLGKPKPLVAVRDVQFRQKKRHYIHIPVHQVEEFVNVQNKHAFHSFDIYSGQMAAADCGCLWTQTDKLFNEPVHR